MRKAQIVFTITFLLSILYLPVTAQNIAGNGKISIVIHGGAGTILRTNMTPAKEKAYHAVLKAALNVGYKSMEDGGSSEEAVVASIIIMENSPLFNAGKGAVFTNSGTNELDASIMNGYDGTAGAVAGVKRIKNPILAAQMVKNKSEHVLLTGTGAEGFAMKNKMKLVEPSYFYTEKRYRQLMNIQKKPKGQGKLLNENNDYKFGTVGVVALDANGNIAAGTSTGGMTNKRFGRVGDAPIIGAGTYADNATCGVSGTGHGEFFMRNLVAYDIAAMMKYKGVSLAEAADAVVMKKLKQIGGGGGIVSLDAKGNISMTFNTAGMYRGYMNVKNEPHTYIYEAVKDE